MIWDTINKYGGAVFDSGTVIAILALVVSVLNWLLPRQVKKTAVPDFFGVVDQTTMQNFSKFIRENEDRVVRIRAVVPMNEEDIWSESDDEEGNVYHGLSLKNKSNRDGDIGGMEVGIHPEKGSKSSPMIFANGGYHLNGFFVIRMFPGVHHGWIAASITELSAEQLAMRS